MKINTSFLRILSGIWGIITFMLFVFDFFTKQLSNTITSTSTVVYGVVLALYVSTKEFKRWGSKKGEFRSIYFGEFYPLLWSVAMVVFVIMSFLTNGKYKIPTEFPATYITILGIYIISQQSKAIYKKR